MSQEELQRKGNNEDLKGSRRQEAFHNPGIGISPSKSQNSSFQFETGESNQNLRNNQNIEKLYQSEDRGQEYHNTNQSFNEQRYLYAEQALNAQQPQEEPEQQTATQPPVSVTPAGYDYQTAIYIPESKHGTAEFRRYVKDVSSKGNSISGIGAAKEQDAGKGSIFNASDADLARAIDYLDQDNARYSKKLNKVWEKYKKNDKDISALERYGLKYRYSYRIWKHRPVFDREGGAWVARQKLRYKGKRIYKENYYPVVGRLKFRTVKVNYTNRQHGKRVHKAERNADKRRYRLKQTAKEMRRTASGSDFYEDEVLEGIKRKGSRYLTGLSKYTRKHIRNLKHELDGYKRLNFKKSKHAALNAKMERLNYKSGINLQKRKVDEAAKQGLLRGTQKKKLKKEMVQQYKREQGNFVKRNLRQHQLKKTIKKEKRMARKRVKALVSSAIAIITVVILVFFTFALLLTVFLGIAGETYSNSVSQNDYSTMTEVTAYFREKEAELEEYLKPENLEPILLAENPDIYEFIYVLDEISFDANTLVAYLSAKYNEFSLEMVKADLDELFEQYYTLTFEIKMEEREVPDTTQARDPVTGEYPKVKKMVPICYVILEKKDFFELCKSRIDDAGKQNQMDAFYLTGNGQQVYGPVMVEDWRNKISSNYGWRVHPITGVKTFHKGVDIAVPTGTALYSPVKGTVITSVYSDSAGNKITIQNETGWTVTFMHMDSRAVKAGDVIEQGQHVGYSGNTGNSTGPHLHLEIHDAEGNTVNPIFIVPFSTIEASETY